MTFTEWLQREVVNDREMSGFLKEAIHEKNWPHTSNDLKSFVQHLKTQGAGVDICGNLLKFWAKYLKVVSGSRPITADEIRDIREVLFNMLNWIRSNSRNLSDFEEGALAEAEGQVACLEEKEIELRFINRRLHESG